MDLRRHISELSEEIDNLERLRQNARNTIIEDELGMTIDRLKAERQRCQLKLQQTPSRFVTLVKHVERIAVAVAFLFLLTEIMISFSAYGSTSAHAGYTFASKLHLTAYGVLVLAGARRLIIRIFRCRHRILEVLRDNNGGV